MEESTSHRVEVLHDILEGRMRSELFEQLPLVEQRVQQVWVVMERVTQTGVYDLQHHSDHLLDDVQILSLRENHDAVNTDMITAINYISLFFLLPCASGA